MTITATRPATQKQFDFIKRLLDERELDITAEDWVPAARGRAVQGNLTSVEASSLINHLLTLPRKTVQQSADEPEAGVYQVPFGETFRVYLGQQSGKMLVKRILFSADGPAIDWSDVPDNQVELVAESATGRVEYEYLGTAASKLPKEAERLSLEQVGALGKSWDHCLICGARLDDPESVDRGIGPVCAKKY